MVSSPHTLDLSRFRNLEKIVEKHRTECLFLNERLRGLREKIGSLKEAIAQIDERKVDHQGAEKAKAKLVREMETEEASLRGLQAEYEAAHELRKASSTLYSRCKDFAWGRK